MDNKVVIERKVLTLKRKVKNPSDRRVQGNRTTTVFYLPIARDLADRLGLDENSFIKAEIAKSQLLEQPNLEREISVVPRAELSGLQEQPQTNLISGMKRRLKFRKSKPKSKSKKRK
jgi:hypothetical protein